MLGWIFIFPVPLTILMLRNQKLSKPVKIGIIVAAWIVYLIIGLVGGGSGDNKDSSNANTETTTIEQPAYNSAANDSTAGSSESAIDSFIAEINKSEDISLEYVENFILLIKRAVITVPSSDLMRGRIPQENLINMEIQLLISFFPAVEKSKESIWTVQPLNSAKT